MRISTDHLFWPIALMLLGASLFFTASVTSFKKELNLSATTLEINSGQEAMVVKIIDGDEVSVVTKTGLWRDPDIAWRSIQLKNKWHMEAEKE